jgi:hypothetical protein
MFWKVGVGEVVVRCMYKFPVRYIDGCKWSCGGFSRRFRFCRWLRKRMFNKRNGSHGAERSETGAIAGIEIEMTVLSGRANAPQSDKGALR